MERIQALSRRVKIFFSVFVALAIVVLFITNGTDVAESYKNLSWLIWAIGACLSFGLLILEHFTKTSFMELKDVTEQSNGQSEMLMRSQVKLDTAQEKIYHITEEYVTAFADNQKQLTRIEGKTDSINDNFITLKKRVTDVEQDLFDMKINSNKLKTLVKENSEAISRIDRNVKRIK